MCSLNNFSVNYIYNIMQDSSKENLVTLNYTTATAKVQEDGSVVCHHEVISEKG